MFLTFIFGLVTVLIISSLIIIMISGYQDMDNYVEIESQQEEQPSEYWTNKRMEEAEPQPMPTLSKIDKLKEFVRDTLPILIISFIILTAIFALLWYTDFFNTPEFIGTIESIENDNAIVKIEEGKILKSGDKASVDLSVAKDTTFQIGDKIKVRYGKVRERYPLYIETKSVKLID